MNQPARHAWTRLSPGQSKDETVLMGSKLADLILLTPKKKKKNKKHDTTPPNG